jgi:type IV secretory pathway VirD2 relaxase
VATDDGIHPIEYAVERRSLLTDSGTVYLQYVFRNEDPATWDTNLLELMEVRMAAAMAMAVTGDAAKKQEFEREALQILRMARAVDGMENPAQPFPESSLMSVRR